MKLKLLQTGHLYYVVMIFCLVLAPNVATAVPIIETATFVSLPEVGYELGSSLSQDQWLGMRFMTTGSTHVTSIGGYLGSGGRASDPAFSILQFAAIVPLGSQALPVTTDLLNDALFFSLFEVPSRGSGGTLGEDIVIDIDIALEEGAYGLIYGHNPDWGTTGTGGYMPSTGTRIGEPSFFIARTLDHNWESFPLSNFSGERAWRFTIEGEALVPGGGLKPFDGEVPSHIPEPPVALIVGTGFAVLILINSRSRRGA